MEAHAAPAWKIAVGLSERPNFGSPPPSSFLLFQGSLRGTWLRMRPPSSFLGNLQMAPPKKCAKEAEGRGGFLLLHHLPHPPRPLCQLLHTHTRRGLNRKEGSERQAGKGGGGGGTEITIWRECPHNFGLGGERLAWGLGFWRRRRRRKASGSLAFGEKGSDRGFPFLLLATSVRGG